MTVKPEVVYLDSHNTTDIVYQCLVDGVSDDIICNDCKRSLIAVFSISVIGKHNQVKV